MKLFIKLSILIGILAISTLVLCLMLPGYFQNAGLEEQFNQIGIIVIITFAVCIAILGIVIILLKNKNRKLEDIAYFDETTDVYSIQKFREIFKYTLENTDKKYAIIITSINNFSGYVNRNTYYQVDKTIYEVATILKKNALAGDVVARWYSDHFLVLLSYERQDEIFEYINNVAYSISAVALSFGIVLELENCTEFDMIQEFLLKALKKAEQSSKLYSVYNEREEENLELEIREKMKDAIKNEEFLMYLQPKFDLTTTKCCGAEAFVRWRKSDNTFFSPRKFIPIFEETGYIFKMELQILQQACIKLREWIDNGITPVPISLNVSKKYFLDNKFVNDVLAMVDKYEIPQNLLEFDITDTSSTISIQDLKSINSNFYGRDLMVSIDDKSSAIHMLEDMRVNTIKLGGSFFYLAMNNSHAKDTLKNFIKLTNEHDIKVIAEGIETQDQIDLIKSIGVNTAQGFYFAKTLPVREFEELIFDL